MSMFTPTAADRADKIVALIRTGGYIVISCALADRIGWLNAIAATFALMEVLRALRRGSGTKLETT